MSCASHAAAHGRAHRKTTRADGPLAGRSPDREITAKVRFGTAAMGEESRSSRNSEQAVVAKEHSDRATARIAQPPCGMLHMRKMLFCNDLWNESKKRR